jgi:hypothetical protein
MAGGPALAMEVAVSPLPDAAALASRVGIPARLDRPGFEPVMAHPTFPVPTALALLATDPEWFLPGVGIFPGNRVTLLQFNGPFIESYLAGLNHEMMRELRWREYPTDLRGTPFTRFWPRPDGEPDVPPMHGWGFRLGDNLTLPDEGISVLLWSGAKQLPDCDGLLAVLGELRPVAADRGIEVERSTRVAGRHGRGRHPLGRGEDGDEGVVFEGELADAVAVAAPQVHDRSPVAPHRTGRADLPALGKVATEGIRDRPVALFHVASHQIHRHINLQHHDPLPSLAACTEASASMPRRVEQV